MKTNISKLIAGVCLFSSLGLTTGCIEETIPTSVATEDQVTSSDMAAAAMLWAMPASLNVVGVVSSSYHWDWGYGSIMHVRDVMTGDMPVVSSGYNWYTNWEVAEAQGESYVYPQFIWNYYWQAVLTTNKLIAAIDAESASSAQLGYLAAAHAFRAFFYMDLARMYEFLPSDKIPTGVNDAGNDVSGLTVPIVRETITEEEARNNPRVSREVMAEFILSDLDFAEQNIDKLEESSKTLPHLDVVYGLKARLYMWLEDYPKAKEYARKAINATGVSPMTETQCLSTSKGFNDISCWMWGSQMVSEDDVVKTGILNWASWMSNETSFGYSGQEPYLMISKSMYDRLSNTDFRKKMWKAPEGSMLDGQTDYLTSAAFGNFGDRLSDYASVKFRPAEGNCDDYTTGAATAYPLMRVEEMYFIEAEAAAHSNAEEGKTLLTNFMLSYRDGQYSTTASGVDKVVDEIIFQKRVELWGEGLTFFDIKRLNMPVTRGYPGTNYQDDARYNTTTRPAWMSICIVQTEKNNNAALVGFENPEVSDELYTPWAGN